MCPAKLSIETTHWYSSSAPQGAIRRVTIQPATFGVKQHSVVSMAVVHGASSARSPQQHEAEGSGMVSVIVQFLEDNVVAGAPTGISISRVGAPCPV